jgi:N-acetylmuramoyl-L-alanine amidase
VQICKCKTQQQFINTTIKQFNMLPFAYYILKITICSAVLFGYYWFALRNKVFHGYNRFYLLTIVGLSLTLPLCRINIFQEKEEPQTSVIKMLQVVTASDEYMDEVVIAIPQKSNFSLIELLPFLYLLVSVVLFVMLIQMLLSIFALWKNGKPIKIEQIHFINTDAAKGTPFSFFKSIFWNQQIDMYSPAGKRIFKHELAHIQERHSWDKMFINLVLIVFWSNPIFWLIRRELSMIHEFIADKRAVEDGDTAAFASMILAATYPQHQNLITNNFFYSPIKRRLMMLTKNKHPRVNYISRLLVLPLLVIVFAAFTIKAREYKVKQTTPNGIAKTAAIENGIRTDVQIPKLNDARSTQSEDAIRNIATDKQITVVLDAGHGGQDPGVTNKNGITEKDLALELVKKIKELNTNKNVKIILTRETDVFANPKAKASFANEHNADFFISIHLDNTPKEKWNTASGLNVYVSRDGSTNTEKSKLLASVIIGSFKNNYGLEVGTNPQQRQAGIWILQANDFPSIIIEAGYLTNDKDAAYLLSKKGQETFANNVLNAINNFAASNDFSASNTNAEVNSIEYIEYKEQQKLHLVQNNTEDTTSADSKAVNLLQEVFKDSNETVILLYGKRIDRKLVSQIMNNEKFDLTVYPAENAFKKFGIKTKNGLADITKRYPKVIVVDPIFRIGNLTSNRIKVNEFTSQKMATVTDGYEFVSCNVYFGGTGFPKAEATKLNGNDFTQLSTFLERCAAGTSIAFTNIKVKNKDGLRVIEEKAYMLY